MNFYRTNLAEIKGRFVVIVIKLKIFVCVLKFGLQRVEEEVEEFGFGV